jgi:hypothetical protein
MKQSRAIHAIVTHVCSLWAALAVALEPRTVVVKTAFASERDEEPALELSSSGAESAPPPAVRMPAMPAGDMSGVAESERKFAIQTTDGAFELRLGLQAAYVFEPRWRNGNSQEQRTFTVLRPTLAGNLFASWARFCSSFEFAAAPPFLLDSYLELWPLPEIGIRVGQQFTPLSRHENFGPREILFPDWSNVADFFWSGRDKGVTVLGALARGSVEYWLGVYSGTPVRKLLADERSHVFVARATINPMGPVAANEALYITSESPVPFRVSFSLQGYHRNVVDVVIPAACPAADGPAVRQRQTLAAADVWIQGARFSVLAEGYMRRTSPNCVAPPYTSIGAWAQAGVMLVDRLVDVGVRASLLQLNADVDGDLEYMLEGMLGYYPLHSQNLVAKLRYGYGEQHALPAGDMSLRAALVRQQLVTLQLGWAI